MHEACSIKISARLSVAVASLLLATGAVRAQSAEVEVNEGASRASKRSTKTTAQERERDKELMLLWQNIDNPEFVRSYRD